MQCPLDYSLCNQTVTLYRLRNGTVQRRVVDGVHYRYWTQEKLDAAGKSRETGCLLIIPGKADIQPGDRVYPGVGPQITAQTWAGFLPVQIPGLAQIRYVAPQWWQGEICHTEGK